MEDGGRLRGGRFLLHHDPEMTPRISCSRFLESVGSSAQLCYRTEPVWLIFIRSRLLMCVKDAKIPGHHEACLAGAVAALIGLIEEFPQNHDLRVLPFLNLTFFFLPLPISRPDIRGKTGMRQQNVVDPP